MAWFGGVIRVESNDLGTAFIVDTTQNVTTAFLSALNAIRTLVRRLRGLTATSQGCRL